MALINFHIKLQDARIKAVVFLATPVHKGSYFYFLFTSYKFSCQIVRDSY